MLLHPRRRRFKHSEFRGPRPAPSHTRRSAEHEADQQPDFGLIHPDRPTEHVRPISCCDSADFVDLQFALPLRITLT
jgi:hypothetical protein